MYKISKSFQFSASHTLKDLPTEHPCSHLHGHNYTVVVELQSKTLDETGFVLDYRALEPLKKYIDTFLDHRHLNDVIKINPTAENLAKHLFAYFTNLLPSLRFDVRISAVTVKETDKTTARYEEFDS